MTNPVTICTDKPETEDSLEAYLASYRPTALPASAWEPLAAPAAALVKKAGPLTLDRVRKDMTTLTAVAAFVSTQGRPLTLPEILADSTLTAFDGHRLRQGAKPGTRQNERGRIRRLRAALHDVPWRRERRADGQRVATLPSPALVSELAKVEMAASHDTSTAAASFRAVVTAVRNERDGVPESSPVEKAAWTTARRYAAENGWNMTKQTLAAALTYELLAAAHEPLAVIAARVRLTRTDLDRGLALAAALPDTWSPEHRSSLRGA